MQVLERAEALETAYARLALHRLAQAAEARGGGGGGGGGGRGGGGGDGDGDGDGARLVAAAERAGQEHKAVERHGAVSEAAEEAAEEAEEGWEVETPEPFVAQDLHAQLPPLPPRTPREASGVSREEKVPPATLCDRGYSRL